jgi:RHS repeat-associated protein
MTDSTGLVYLRARYYAADTGRFISRDTWPGQSNRPLSLNRWNYVEGNVVNLTDPSGRCVYAPTSWNVGKVESKLPNLSKTDWLNTYTVAGLAVQCWAESIDGRIGNDSWGPAQVSFEQVREPYGTGAEIKNLGDNLRCYVLRFYPNITQCFTSDEIKDCPDISKLFRLEPPLNPFSWQNAATLMRRRIQHAIDATCKDKNGKPIGCQDTDRYIIAGMAQNGPGFVGFENYEKDDYRPSQDETTIYNWRNYYSDRLYKNTSKELERFRDAVNGFILKGWSAPPIDTNLISDLIVSPH